MPIVAKGTLSISTVYDSMSVSCNPSSLVIKTEYDGTNPELDNAYADISVLKVKDKVMCKVTGVTKSNPDIAISGIDQDYQETIRIRITGFPANIGDGNIVIHLETIDGAQFDTSIYFSVIREASMLDWIADWDTRKTKIGDTYIISPRLFIGKKMEFDKYGELFDGSLTGVYIGPDGEFGETAGLYGYYYSQEIFHLNESGGMIGGWNITQDGIISSNKKMEILSSGEIKASEKSDVFWNLKSDGSALFAKGNVTFSANGDASFKGEITSTSGRIANWMITGNALRGDRIYIDSTYAAVAILAGEIMSAESVVDVWESLPYGGVGMYYKSATDYGLKGYSVGSGLKTGTLMFSLGSTNSIAGWSFDSAALWVGTKNNTLSNYTASSGSITIGTNGLRGNTWYIDNTGKASFANGKAVFDSSTSKLCGWTLTSNSLYLGSSELDSNDRYTANANSIILSSQTGFHSKYWYFKNDGSGSIGNGLLTWDNTGKPKLLIRADEVEFKLPDGTLNSNMSTLISGGKVTTNQVIARDSYGDVLSTMNLFEEGEYIQWETHKISDTFPAGTNATNIEERYEELVENGHFSSAVSFDDFAKTINWNNSAVGPTYATKLTEFNNGEILFYNEPRNIPSDVISVASPLTIAEWDASMRYCLAENALTDPVGLKKKDGSSVASGTYPYNWQTVNFYDMLSFSRQQLYQFVYNGAYETLRAKNGLFFDDFNYHGTRLTLENLVIIDDDFPPYFQKETDTQSEYFDFYYFDGYYIKNGLRTLYDEAGNIYTGIDAEDKRLRFYFQPYSDNSGHFVSRKIMRR